MASAAPRSSSAGAHACHVCGGGVERVLVLPKLPLTDTYTSAGPNTVVDGFDQALLVCGSCGHGQLEHQLDPNVLYDTSYGFRTSLSATARRGVDFFLDTMDELVGDRRFRCALDLGCNDLYLLERLADRVDHRIGVDPIWSGREHEGAADGLLLVGSTIESVDLAAVAPEPIDLVVCRHTIEHLADPVDVIRRLGAVVAPDAVFVFETPNFDALVRRARFDQVFHQHLQYFSWQSIRHLIEAAGGAVLGRRENYHDWGAMAVAFRLDVSSAIGPWDPAPTVDGVRRSVEAFEAQMAATAWSLDRLGGPWFGYGAGQMLPVLAHHLGTDLAGFTAILDDDRSKDGIGYSNLPVPIWHSSRVESLADASILVTAPDNASPILRRLFELRPRHIVSPLAIL